MLKKRAGSGGAELHFALANVKKIAVPIFFQAHPHGL
jgi:hypothetical protein